MVSLRSSSSDSASDGRRSRNSQLEPEAWSAVCAVTNAFAMRCRPRLLCFKFEHLKALRPAASF